MKIFSSWEVVPNVSQFKLRADNVLSNSGKDYYQPDWIKGLDAKPMVLVRIGKVAKCVDLQFADRYFDALSLGVSLRAKSLEEGLPIAMTENFDSSLMKWGEWLSYEEFTSASFYGVKMLEHEELAERYELMVPTIRAIAQVISELSHYYLLKVGDLVALPVSNEYWSMERGEGIFICDGKDKELIYLRIK